MTRIATIAMAGTIICTHAACDTTTSRAGTTKPQPQDAARIEPVTPRCKEPDGAIGDQTCAGLELLRCTEDSNAGGGAVWVPGDACATAASTDSAATDTVVPAPAATPDEIATDTMKLGHGFDSITGKPAAKCIEIQDADPIPTTGVIQFSHDATESMATVRRRANVGVSATFGIGVYSASYSYRNSQESFDEASSSAAYLETTVESDPRSAKRFVLTSEARKLWKKDPLAFLATCGDSFVAYERYGGSFKASLRVEAKKGESRGSERHQASVIAGAFGSGSAEFKKAVAKASTSYFLKLRILERGPFREVADLNSLVDRARQLPCEVFACPTKQPKSGDVVTLNEVPPIVKVGVRGYETADLPPLTDYHKKRVRVRDGLAGAAARILEQIEATHSRLGKAYLNPADTIILQKNLGGTSTSPTDISAKQAQESNVALAETVAGVVEACFAEPSPKACALLRLPNRVYYDAEFTSPAAPVSRLRVIEQTHTSDGSGTDEYVHLRFGDYRMRLDNSNDNRQRGQTDIYMLEPTSVSMGDLFKHDIQLECDPKVSGKYASDARKSAIWRPASVRIEYRLSDADTWFTLLEWKNEGGRTICPGGAITLRTAGKVTP